MFLNEELLRAGIAGKKAPPAARRGIEWIDPLVWARELQKDEKGKSLAEVAERVGVALEKAHSAIADAEAAVKVLAAFWSDVRVPKTYGAFVQEQRRLARLFAEDRQYWRK
jgi:DNA polymerase-3 subunit epsilon